MGFLRPLSRERLVARAVVTALVMLALSPAAAADRFPFDRELVLDARPMGPAKRVPVLTVGENGRATIDLWCRTVAARVQVQDSAIKIETAPLPDALPRYMSEGQCNEMRVAADNEMLLALAQVTEWRKRGDGVELSGPDIIAQTPLRFQPSSH